jgi:NDP-sugar pyrophosphorylase family protein
MRAVILATRLGTPGGRPRPVALRTVVDRPVVQHVVEQLVQQGARELEVVMCDAPEDVRAVLGDGRRWGVAVRYHLAREADRPARALRLAARGARGSIAIASGDCLVPAAFGEAGGAATVFCTPAAAPGAPAPWSGLACVVPRLLEELPDGVDEEGLGAWLIARAHERGVVRVVHARLSTGTAAEWLAAQRAALEGALPGLLFGGREVRPGVWLGRGARVHASARLVAPVWVGDNARVGPDAVIGPGAVVGGGAMVEKGARVQEALVLPGTYLGEALELRGAVAEAGAITHAGLEARVPVADAFLVGSVAPARASAAVVGSVSRVVAAALLLFALPVAMAGRALAPARGGSPRPSPRDLLGRVLPGLWQVVRGRVGLVGVTPRDERALAALPGHWREACRQTPFGLITEAMVQLDPDSSPEAVAAADAFYSVSRCARHDTWLVGRYLCEAFAAARAPDVPRRPGPEGAPSSRARGPD